MTAVEVYERIKAKYPPPEYVTMRQVANGTGQVKRRYADAVSLSTFPSKGLYLTGFEIKVARGDWLKELDDPEKADEIGKHCRFWYVVTDKQSLIFPGELPPMWGHMVADGETLKTVKRCEPREAAPPDWGLLAAILRRAFDVSPEAGVAQQLNEAKWKGFAEGEKAGKAAEQRMAENYRRSAEQLHADVQAFSEASGATIQSWSSRLLGGKTHAQQLGEALKLLMNGGLDHQLAKFEFLRTRAAEVALEVASTVVAINNMKEFRRANGTDPGGQAAAVHAGADAGRAEEGAGGLDRGDRNEGPGVPLAVPADPAADAQLSAPAG